MGPSLKLLRLKGGARSAGRAMSATPQGKGIPWHRVLNAAGKIVIREPYSVASSADSSNPKASKSSKIASR